MPRERETPEVPTSSKWKPSAGAEERSYDAAIMTPPVCHSEAAWFSPETWLSA